MDTRTALATAGLAIALVVSLRPAPGRAQRPAGLAVEVPSQEINGALDQRLEFEVRNTGRAAVRLRLRSLVVRVAGTGRVVPLALRALYLDGARRGRGEFTIAPSSTHRVSIETHAPRALNLPRSPSHLIVTLGAGTRSFRVQGPLVAISRCLDCR